MNKLKVISIAVVIALAGVLLGVQVALVRQTSNIQAEISNIQAEISNIQAEISNMQAEVSNIPVGKTATLVVAANNSSDQGKAQADYVCDGTHDQEEIQAAIDALPSAGGKVMLLEGTYTLGADVRLKSNMVLEGQGWQTILRRAATSKHSLISDGAGNTDVIVRNLCLDGNQNAGASPYVNRYSHGIILQYVERGLIENVLIKNVGSGGRAKAGGDGLLITGLAKYITVRGVMATNIGTEGDSSYAFEIAHGGEDIILTECWAIDCAHNFSLHNHAGSDGPQRVSLNHCRAANGTDGNGFSVQGNSGALSDPQYIEFNNCVSYKNSGDGFHVSPYTKYITINGGCSIEDGGVGVRLVGAPGTWEGIRAIGISVIGSGDTGISGNTGTDINGCYVNGPKGDYGIYSLGSVRNCHVKHCRQDGTEMIGIAIEGGGICEGNEVEDCGGWAIAVVNKTTFGRISGNYCHDNASCDIVLYNSDNQIVEDNVCLSPVSIWISSDSDNNTVRNNQFAGTITDDSTTTTMLPSTP